MNQNKFKIKIPCHSDKRSGCLLKRHLGNRSFVKDEEYIYVRAISEKFYIAIRQKHIESFCYEI